MVKECWQKAASLSYQRLQRQMDSFNLDCRVLPWEHKLVPYGISVGSPDSSQLTHAPKSPTWHHSWWQMHSSDLYPSSTWFLWPTWVSPSNSTSIGSALFAGLTNVTNRHTHTQTQADYTTPCVVIRTDYDKCDICSNRLHLMHWVYVMWPNYWQNSWKLHVHNITNRTSKTKKTAVLTINTVNTLSPSELCVPVADVAGHRQLRSTSRGLLYFPCYNMSNYGRCAFSYADPHALNLLAENVRKWKCIAIFKRSLKMFLFEQITHSEH